MTTEKTIQTLTADLKNQGNAQALLRAMKEQAKKVKEEIAALKEKIPHISFGKKKVQVSEKGALSFYLGGKFPTTLYYSQLIDLKQIINSAEFKKFVEDNKDQLAMKEEKTA